MVDAWIMKIMTGKRKCEAAFFRIKYTWASYAGTFAMVLQWLAVIQLHRLARPCHGVASDEKKKRNYIMNELVKISLFGFFCNIRNWFTCAFAHVTFTCRLRWRRIPHSSSTWRGILSDRFLKNWKTFTCFFFFFVFLFSMNDECHWIECDE